MKTALVTGASRGIGAQIVRKLAGLGWRVAFTYLTSEEAAKGLAKETGALAIRCEARNEQEIAAATETVLHAFRHVDALVHNAGTAWTGLLQDMPTETWDDLFSLHVKGAFLHTRALLPSMISRQQGSILYITSMWGEVGASMEVGYSACKAAQKCGVTVSCDLNYRKNLWKYGKEAKEVMSEIAKYVDVAIANEEDFQKSLGITASSDVESGSLDRNVYEGIAKKAMELYPNLKRVAITLRESKSADRNDWAACIYDGKEFYVSRKYEITDIVDRVGGGDSFSGGLIYGLLTYEKQSDALEYAVAASCLKHTISGDYNRVTVSEVTALMKGSGSGRVER